MLKFAAVHVCLRVALVMIPAHHFWRPCVNACAWRQGSGGPRLGVISCVAWPVASMLLPRKVAGPLPSLPNEGLP